MVNTQLKVPTGDENGSDQDGYHWYYICFHISIGFGFEYGLCQLCQIGYWHHKYAIWLVRMAMGQFRVGYPRVSGLAGSDSGIISHPRFSGSGPRNPSGLFSGLVFHLWISEINHLELKLMFYNMLIITCLLKRGRPSAGGSHVSGVWGRDKPRQAFPPQNLRRCCFEPTTWWLSETALTTAPGLPF
jgi:hypothetical protein